MYIDPVRLSDAVRSKLGTARCEDGIGTLGEKTLHAALKSAIEPRTEFHEIPVGRYIADIYNEEGITEIQTGGFYPLRDKLSAYLPEHTVRIVCPIPAQKFICWIDEKSGAVTPPRKSPLSGTYFNIFRELGYIRHMLPNDRLHICPVLLSVTDYRLLNGWSQDRKRGSVRYERIPHEVLGCCDLCTPADYASLLPELPETFTAKQLAKEAHIRLPAAQSTVRVLSCIGVLEKCGMQGRAYLYRRLF